MHVMRAWCMQGGSGECTAGLASALYARGVPCGSGVRGTGPVLAVQGRCV